MALRAGLAILEHLPRTVAVAAGRTLGNAAYRLLTRRRRTALANLELVWPMEQHQRDAIARGSFQSLGRLLVEFARMGRLGPEVLDKFVVWEGWEGYQRALEAEKGVLYLAAHFGPWELLPYAQAVRGEPMAFVVRPADNPWVEAVVRERRERAGNSAIAKQRSVGECLRCLRRGQTVGVLIDQHVPAEWGVPTRFFGQEVYTTPMLAALALRTGAPVLPAFALPEPDGRVRIVLGPEVHPTRTGSRALDLGATTQSYVSVVEDHIRRRPELWLWSHRRFRAPAVPANRDRGPGQTLFAPSQTGS